MQTNSISGHWGERVTGVMGEMLWPETGEPEVGAQGHVWSTARPTVACHPPTSTPLIPVIPEDPGSWRKHWRKAGQKVKMQGLLNTAVLMDANLENGAHPALLGPEGLKASLLVFQCAMKPLQTR